MKRIVFIVLSLFLAACGGNTTQPATPQAPTIDSFSASPPTIAAAGDAATLNWSISGSYDTLQLTDSVSTNVLNVSGTSFTVNPSVTTTYRLTATGDGGSASRETTVVLQGTDPTPQPTPTPPETPPTNPDPPETPPNNPDPPSNPPGSPAKPTINSFSASPKTIQPGDTAILSWNVSGATSLKIDNNVGTVTGTSVSVTPTKTTTYTLTATNAGGNTTAKTTVNIDAPTNEVPFYGRWLVTFDGGGNDSTFVHELNIDTLDEQAANGGSGQQVFCHVGATGQLCSSFKDATGSGFINGSGSSAQLYLLDGLTPSEARFQLQAPGLTLSTGPNGRQQLAGQGTYLIDGVETYQGTVSAVNVGNPRQLE